MMCPMSSDPHKPIIGLLGAPGSGKSFVAGVFAAQGCAVIDADELAREAMRQPEVLDQIRRWWGPAVFDAQGQVDRAAVGRIVFADARQKQRLEGLIHPRVHQMRQQARRRLAADPAVRAIVEDTPLLLEAGLADECDLLIFVDAPRELRLQRVRSSRGWDQATLAAREKNQAPLDIKRKRADDVIDNSGNEAQIQAQVSRLLSRINPDRA